MKRKHTCLHHKQCLLVTSLILLSPGLAYADSDDPAAPIPLGSSGGSSGDFLGIFPRAEANGPLQGLYFGAGPGMISTDYADSVDDGSVTMIGGSDEGAAYNFFMGYRFNDYFAMEAGFTASDDIDYNAMSSGGPSWAAGPVSAEYDAKFFTISGLVRYPVAPRWWVFGKIGVTWWETTETFNESGAIFKDTDSGTEVFVGLGLEYDVGREDRLIYRFELGYQPVGDDDDLDVFSVAIGARYEFP